MAAFKRTIDAYNAGDSTTFNSMFMKGFMGFDIDGGPLVGGNDISAPPQTPTKPRVGVRSVVIKVYGTTAVIAGYFVGTMYERGVPVSGTWRFTQTDVKEGTAWKGVQFHISPLAPVMTSGRKNETP